jgi:hypothetical protein
MIYSIICQSNVYLLWLTDLLKGLIYYHLAFFCVIRMNAQTSSWGSTKVEFRFFFCW